MNKKALIIIIIIVVVIAAAGGFYYFQYQRKDAGEESSLPEGAMPKIELPQAEKGAPVVDLGKATENPWENMPSTNPLEGAVNPYEDSYQNPFTEGE